MLNMEINMTVNNDKKVNTSISINSSTLKNLKELKKKHGVNFSWVIQTLLDNYIQSWKEFSDEEI